MLVSLLLIATITAGGFALSYAFDDDAPLMWRLAAGNIVGCVVFGGIAFALALAIGLNVGVLIGALLTTSLPLLIFWKKVFRRRAAHDWASAKGKLQGATTRKFLRFGYYAFFFLLFFFFFDRAMLESPAGIFTGGSQNLGDLPFHLGAILGFTEGNNFPPENPSFAGARFSYPFIADLVTAGFVKLGSSIRDAMFVQNVLWAFSLLVILERFVFKLTSDRLAGRLGPAILFFSGGLGFAWFFADYGAQAKGFIDFLTHMPTDYTIGKLFRWGNSMVVLFLTQRSLLLGMPLTLIVLGYLWKVFIGGERSATEQTEERSNKGPGSLFPSLPFSLSPLLVGLLAGMLPLVHLHSLVVLFVVGVFVFIIRPELWRTWALFAAGVAIIAIPELLWSMAGSASETKKFFAWHFGWDRGDANFLWFWIKNTGLFIPLLVAAIYLFGWPRERPVIEQTEPHAHTKKKSRERKHSEQSPGFIDHSKLLFFYLPFAFLFVVSNAAKLAPWEWDNIKVLIYWFVGSIPFVALLLSSLWRTQKTALKTVCVIFFVLLVASGALDVWRTVSGQINYKVFDKDAVEVAEQIKRRTDPKSIFLNAPTYNTAVVLTGRRSLMRYPGHLNSHGINYAERDSDVKQIYQGSESAVRLLEKYGIDYVVVSPEERNLGGVNEQFFSRFPVAAEAGQYRVYKVK